MPVDASARQHESLRGWSVLDPLNRRIIICTQAAENSDRRRLSEVISWTEKLAAFGAGTFICLFINGYLPWLQAGDGVFLFSLGIEYHFD